jgi:hypothetical protein
LSRFNSTWVTCIVSVRKHSMWSNSKGCDPSWCLFTTYIYVHISWDQYNCHFLSTFFVSRYHWVITRYQHSSQHRDRRRKECNMMDKTGQISWRISPPDSCKHLSLLIPIPSTHFWNVEYGRDFVNRSARLSQDFVCKMLIFPFSCFHLNNTSSIILIDNCRRFNRIMVRCSPMDL